MRITIFGSVSNPESLKEGAAVNDCMRPDPVDIHGPRRVAELGLRRRSIGRVPVRSGRS